MSSIKLGDSLMKVPTLDVAGLNWVIYKDRFLWSIDARGLLDHVDGSTTEPERPVLRPRRAAAAGVRTPAATAAAGAGDTGTEGPKDLEPRRTCRQQKLSSCRTGRRKSKSGSRGRPSSSSRLRRAFPILSSSKSAAGNRLSRSGRRCQRFSRTNPGWLL